MERFLKPRKIEFNSIWKMIVKVAKSEYKTNGELSTTIKL